NRPSSSGLRANIGDIVNRQTGFKRDFVAGRVQLQIPIQAEIACDADTEPPEITTDGLETVGRHGCRLSACKDAVQQRFRIAIIRDDNVSADSEEAFAFP